MKIVWPFSWWRRPDEAFLGDGWKRFAYGSKGPINWVAFKRGDLTFRVEGPQEGVDLDELMVTIKGMPASRDKHWVMWEGSVPKALGIQGPATGDLISVWERFLRSEVVPEGIVLGPAFIRRCDLTFDVADEDSRLLFAAIGWNPHARSRYVESRHFNPVNGGSTVFLHNKSRGIRVYEKYPECGEEWARGISRVEVQLFGDWCEKLGIHRPDGHFEAACREYLEPLCVDLCGRAGIEMAPGSYSA